MVSGNSQEVCGRERVMADEKPKRVFLAIELPEDVKNRIILIQDELKILLKGIRWTRPEGIHLTLKFFGNIYEKEIIHISEVIAENTKNAETISLNGGEIGAFPNPGRPRVLWLGLNGDIERLSILQEAIDIDLEVYGYKRERRKFSPHLTLGRVKSSGERIMNLSQVIKRGEDYRAGQFNSRGLTLFQSELKPGGAIYTKLAYFRFGG
jgi:2'-5' RNA ligase